MLATPCQCKKHCKPDVVMLHQPACPHLMWHLDALVFGLVDI